LFYFVFSFQAEEVLEDILAFEASSLASDSIKVTDSALNISPDIQVRNC
jgi:hypothetical protein